MIAQKDLINYYRPILPDVELFEQITQQSLPTTFWVNALRNEPYRVSELLRQEGYDLEPIAWQPHAFRCAPIDSVGHLWQYLTGLIQIQEEVSMLPVTILKPQPGERVLDMCAAPGNKTAEAAVAMQNSGTLIANDCNYGRMRAMGQIMKRLGLMNISLSIQDAVKFPSVDILFDKIIVDAPCSCEGTFRKHKDRVIHPSRDFALKLAKRQKAILRRAVELCRPGGRIVYSTCTFAPEENEGVVSAILKEFSEQLCVIPIEMDNFNYSPGVTEWFNDRYDEQVKGTMRVWPHQNNTGGFYVALLEKSGDVKSSFKQENARGFSDQPPQVLPEVNERFGFDNKIWDNFQFSAGTKKGFYLTNKDNTPPSLRYDSTGMFFLKTKTQHPKLTTATTMLLGHLATRNTLTLNVKQRQAYLSGEEVVVDESQLEKCDSTGYVIVFHQGFPIGMGLFLSAYEDKPPRLRSLFPKYFSVV